MEVLIYLNRHVNFTSKTGHQHAIPQTSTILSTHHLAFALVLVQMVGICALLSFPLPLFHLQLNPALKL